MNCLMAISTDGCYDTWKAQTGSVNLSQVDRLSPEIGHVKRIGG